MTRPTIEQIRQLGDFAPMFRWNVSFATFPSGVNAPPSEAALNLRCESAGIPKTSNTNIEINIRGHKVHQPGIMEYEGTITLKFTETVDMMIHKFLKSWREAIWKTKDGVAAGAKSTLQAEILLQQLDNTDTPIWEYKLIGVTLQDYTLGELGGDTNEIQKPELTLAYDYFEDKAL